MLVSSRVSSSDPRWVRNPEWKARVQGREGGRRERESVCVDDTGGLCTSRSRDADAGHGDADRDGHSWLQQHGWGTRNGHNET